MISPLLYKGSKLLETPALPLREDSDLTFELTNEMLDAMRDYKGVGLAANQVGLHCRVFVARHRGKTLIAINPKVTLVGNLYPMAEGCLSIPGKYYKTMRAKELVLEYQDQLFNRYKETFIDNMAHIIQHEMDHLNGILCDSHGIEC